MPSLQRQGSAAWHLTSANGEAMAERLGDGQAVLLEKGATALEVAHYLRDRRGLPLISNGISKTGPEFFSRMYGSN
ncbi:hypothetical protein [Cryobacterium sp. TMT1-66-1]|uniref:hypothetical protein n=1 Tax=Cryobacterium sp. TMT1-66-1 TaxID=1259242 RepID=UPI00106BE6F2|nr:hypothetical protein [Cryobacterium sp. TMT1-66-1]TFD08195.1 hypothetical protein E3T29_05505 [Cryobacterium sp. TMT1-66-1]